MIATLWRPDSLQAHDSVADGFFFLFFGLMGGMLVYNLLLFVVVRDTGYLLYVGRAACLAVAYPGIALRQQSQEREVLAGSDDPNGRIVVGQRCLLCVQRRLGLAIETRPVGAVSGGNRLAKERLLIPRVMGTRRALALVEDGAAQRP